MFVDERYLYFIENVPELNRPDTIIFFEILNYVDVLEVKESKRASNWMRVAWAFLKVGGSNQDLAMVNVIEIRLL